MEMASLGSPSLVGRTAQTYSTDHGTQVEYLAADGHAILWYPQRPIPWVGEWERRTGQMCFRYLVETTSGLAFSEWTCSNWNTYMRSVNELWQGDIFNLDTRSVPFTIPDRDVYSITELADQAGIDLSTTQDVMLTIR
ncbi:hypothetical protein BVC71_00225 [Marivivens niveibacter]|uniref:Uncharacterized protein n=2 Tax=Marivivens niveibacter TaxID=1930667 RepID=A0A251X073_9RHOB|nr:hypothetical protein BVC71_00225 [Marivivens niveibacter]